jgi:4,5-dihydroxyphthalate decarboxylase
VWARGLLHERHGVDLSKLRWVIWGAEVFPIHDAAAQIEFIGNRDKSVADALLDGDVDALITDISDAALFETLEGHPNVRRLFPDYPREDERLYRETGIYTPVHLIVMSRQLDQQRPELARQLYDAFEQAKAQAYKDILSDLAGFSVVYLRERMLEQRERWGDPFAYGMAANKNALDTFMRYNVEQGMIRAPLAYEQVFARSTLGT